MVGLARIGWLGAAVVVVAAAGCRGGGSKGAEDFQLQQLTRPAQISDAPKVYEAAGCPRCHGAMAAGGGSAPSLAHEGSQHDVMWIGDHIRNPQAHNPASTMPSYGDEAKYAYGNIQALASALANQK